MFSEIPRVCTHCYMSESCSDHMYLEWPSGTCRWVLASYESCCCVFEPGHDKTNKMTQNLAKTRISLGIHPVWSWSSLCTLWVAKNPRFLHADSEDSGQTAQADLSLCWAHRSFCLCSGSIYMLKEESKDGGFSELNVVNSLFFSSRKLI